MYNVFVIYGVFGLDFCGVYEAFGLVFSFHLYFIFCGVAWRSVACSVYGAFGWDPCGVHNVCSDYKAFGLVVFCGIKSVCSVYGALGWDLCGVYSVSSVYGALGLDVCGV